MPRTYQAAQVCGALAIFTLGVAAASSNRYPLAIALLFVLAALLLKQAGDPH